MLMAFRSDESAHEPVATMEQIPGHAATVAEVWLWRDPAPTAQNHATPRVVLQADDWPMSAEAARQLAALLIVAAQRAEQVASSADNGNTPGPGPGL
jgi:hypothetical protein